MILKIKNKINKNLEQEKISILVPMYNSEKTVEKSVKSIMKQTYKNMEIIVVDDGSKDSSYKIVEKLAKQDSRIKLLHKENEKSLAKTRKFLIDHATSEYVVFVDSDDIIKPKYVETLYNGLKINNADCCAVGFIINGIIPFANVFTSDLLVTDDDIIPTMILSRNLHFVLWNKIYKTEILKKSTLAENFSLGEDFAICYNYFKQCSNVVYINKCHYVYKLQKGSQIHKKFSQENVKFLNYLEDIMNTEKNEKIKNSLKAWICFTSASYKYLMKKSKVKDENLTNRLNENIEKYKPNLITNPHLDNLYKVMFNIMK